MAADSKAWLPLAVAVVLAAAGFGVPGAAAQPIAAPDSLSAPVDTARAAPSYRVGRISVAGNTWTDSARVMRSFEVASGSPYADEPLKRGVRKLFSLGLFSDVWLTRTVRGDEVDLVIHVRERPRVASIAFTGNQERETSELERKLSVRAGDVYTPNVAQAQVDSLVAFYRGEGFAQARVAAFADTLEDGAKVGLRFTIEEGRKVKIHDIRFEGATAFAPGKLRKQMKTKKKGLFGGGEVKEEQFAEDREKLERYYKSHGYRDARVANMEVVPQAEPKKLTLVVTIEQGPVYHMGEVTWQGATVVPAERLERLWRGKPGDLYDATKIEMAQGGAYGEYAEEGYLYVGVEARETVRDSVVDVAYVVTEGRPSSVRYVQITGNKATREKVIRREIDLHEGDRFKRSALVRTQGDLFRLGLFEDVQVDFSAADSTDVDVVLKVKEKQVGTASAGAGYTNEAGLTGFLELGHSNVLGNGQSLSVHLERGSRRSEYFLSFTEPWFRDTPTLLGFTGFHTERERDLYEEKRVGGSGRIGRPLGWPDYSRGSISYRLENVTITQLGDVLTPTDSVALSGVRLGEGVLTSSVELNFLRNSTDNPFYPTKGTRLNVESELAGGPFGGSIHFHKHRFEGRAYLPSIHKRVTTMLKARVGLLGEYADQVHTSVPPYETFRLGGGTTTEPLRGYDDYQIVPGKFIRDVVVRRDTSDAVAPYDSVSVLTDKVRYPGGRTMLLYTVEQQFPVVHPLHAVVFFDAGNTWDLWKEIKPWDLKMGLGAGIRLEIPLLGNIGFDYAYGFNRDDGPRAKGHFLLGSFAF